MSIQDEIRRLTKERGFIQSRIERLQGMIALYPDLEVLESGKGTRYTSAAIATEICDYDIEDSCECCDGPSIQVWMYAATPFGKVYSNKTYFSIGTRYKHRSNGSHYEIFSDWRRILVEALVPAEVIEKIRRELLTKSYEHSSSIKFMTELPK